MKKKQNRYRPDKARHLKILKIWGKSILTLLLAISAVVLISAGLSRSYYALLDAPWLRLEEVRIEGLKHLDEGLVLNALAVPRNTCVLNLKVKELAARLEALPQVRSVIVRLDLPARLVVELTEREPLAIIQAEEPLLLDKEGKLFARTTRDANPDLLLVTGFSGKGLKEGDYLPREPLEAMREMMAALEGARQWLPVQRISECQWRSGGFTLFMAQTSLPVDFGSENYGEKLNRLQRIFAMLGERQWTSEVKYIDLNYGNRAYVGGHFPGAKGA